MVQVGCRLRGLPEVRERIESEGVGGATVGSLQSNRERWEKPRRRRRQRSEGKTRRRAKGRWQGRSTEWDVLTELVGSPSYYYPAWRLPQTLGVALGGWRKPFVLEQGQSPS